MHTLEVIRRRRPNVCSTCGYDMIDFGLRDYDCVNHHCREFMRNELPREGGEEFSKSRT